MAALTPLQRKRRKDQIQTAFNEYKSVGTTLLQLGKIDAEEYYTRVRNKGIDLGIITSNQYPDALPSWVEPVFRITGATAGAILAAPAVITGPGGIAAMSAGAGAGGAAATAAYQQFADFFSDDMPIKPVKEKLKDIGMAGAVDTAGTFVFGGIAHKIGVGLGKARQGTVQGAKNIYNMADDKLSQTAMKAKKGRLGGKFSGVFVNEVDRADALARQIAEQGITPTYGMLGREGFRYVLDALGKMPLIGYPARKAHDKTVQELLNQYNKMTAQYRNGTGFSQPFKISANGRNIELANGAKAGQEFLTRLNDATPWLLISHVNAQGALKKEAYKNAYKAGFDDPLKKIKEVSVRGNQKDLGNVINREVAEYKGLYGNIIDLPTPIRKLLDANGRFTESTLTGKQVFGIQNAMKTLINEKIKGTGRGMGERVAMNTESMRRIREAALFSASKNNNTLKNGLATGDAKYADYSDFLKVNRPIFAHVDELNLGAISGTAAKADIQAGQKLLKEFNPKGTITTGTTGEIRMSNKFAAPSGGGLTNSVKLLQDYANNPARQEVLRQAMGSENYKKFAVAQIDDIFNRQLFNRYNSAGVERGITEAGNFNPTKLAAALGLGDDAASKANWKLTESMLKESGLGKTLTKQKLQQMVDVYKMLPSLPSLSSFLVRSFTLKGTAGPAAILGGSALAGGVGGLVMATGPLMLFTHLMSKPYSAKLVQQAISNPGKFSSALNQEIEKVVSKGGFMGKAHSAMETALSRVDPRGFTKYNNDLRKGLLQIATESTGQATGAFDRPDEDFYVGRIR